MSRLLIAITLLVAALAAVAPAAHAQERKIPQGFAGAVVDGVLNEDNDGSLFEGEADRMVGAGVETVRMVFPWRDAQPRRRRADIPMEQQAFYRDEGGVPTDWRLIDAYVA